MKKITILSLALISLITFSPAYADKENDRIDRDYQEALKEGCQTQKEKSSTTAAILGILPGGGSFYTGEIALGVADLLLWPISIFWDSPLAAARAEKINKENTIEYCDKV